MNVTLKLRVYLVLYKITRNRKWAVKYIDLKDRYIKYVVYHPEEV